MQIRIEHTKKIHSIQKEFSHNFPYLKIEFFSKPHKNGESSLKKHLLRSDKAIGSCSLKPTTKKSISITPNTTVADLEKLFNQAFGLSIQVFRKSGNVWLETTVTDQWTLKKQNDVGKSLSEPASINYTPTPYEDLDLR